MKVEMFHAAGCSACVAAHEELRAAAKEVVKDLDWREVNVADELDYAVEIGVMTLPSIVIDGELVFKSMPTVRQFRAALAARTGAQS